MDLTSSSSSQRKARRSLTKLQLKESVATDLLQLCQTITQDGSISESETDDLRAWLKDNRAADLPAIKFLVATVEQIIADGVVTSDELQGLYKAIESILPPEARKEAVAHRRMAAKEEHARILAERQVNKEREREERERKRPLARANFMVAGVYYEGRPEIIRQSVLAEDQVFLARDRDNKHSRNAVEIRTRHGFQIGFVPEMYAMDFAPLLDQKCPHSAYVTKVLNGRRGPIPVVQAYIFRTDCGEDGVVFETAVPEKAPFHSAQRFGPLLWVVGLLILFGLLLRAC